MKIFNALLKKTQISYEAVLLQSLNLC